MQHLVPSVSEFNMHTADSNLNKAASVTIGTTSGISFLKSHGADLQCIQQYTAQQGLGFLAYNPTKIGTFVTIDYIASAIKRKPSSQTTSTGALQHAHNVHYLVPSVVGVIGWQPSIRSLARPKSVILTDSSWAEFSCKNTCKAKCS